MKTARRVQEFISKQQLFADDAKVLVALSGGADSVALLMVLLELREQYDIKLSCAHVNHNLRGESSRRGSSRHP